MDLGLPVPRAHDRPRRQQQDRRLAGAEGLVVDPDAGAVDVALLIGLSGPQLLDDFEVGLNGDGVGQDVAYR